MKPWSWPRLFAHRGGGSLAPENTLGAISLGQSLGYTAHEIDVKLTLDGVLVLMHDATLERTTNGKGRTADLSFAELKKLDAGSWHSPAFAGERIPSFEEAAALFRSRDTKVHIEIKPTPGFDMETGRAVALATRELFRGAPVAPIFSSFSFEALLAAREAAPEIQRAWLIDQFTGADWDRLARIEAVSLHTSHKKIDLGLLPRLRDKGYRVNLYTVNDIDRAQQLLSAGVDGLFTDSLEAFAARFPGLI
jgi:glycerophosphoryl diester phosphodiesterase